MRPVAKETSPIPGEYDDYRDAYPDLLARIGPYCSYCERRIPTNLAVEHIQPKADELYPELEGQWDNYLLGCVNCNSTKGKKDVTLEDIFLPDRDNTQYIFDYTADGKVRVKNHLLENQKESAERLRVLVGLEKDIRKTYDNNGNIVATDRISQRMEVWGIALESKRELESAPTDGMRRQIERTAAASGFFSVWMQVFVGDTDMRNRFIQAFQGTATDCFDEQSKTISPRPPNHLSHSGKV